MGITDFITAIAGLIILREVSHVVFKDREMRTTPSNKYLFKLQNRVKKQGLAKMLEHRADALKAREHVNGAVWDELINAGVYEYAVIAEQYLNSLQAKLDDLEYQAEQVIADCTARLAPKFNKQYVQAWAKVSKLTLVK